jgi:hypothetical protein
MTFRWAVAWPQTRQSNPLAVPGGPERVRLGRITTRKPVHFALNPEQFLHVVTNFGAKT